MVTSEGHMFSSIATRGSSPGSVDREPRPGLGPIVFFSLCVFSSFFFYENAYHCRVRSGRYNAMVNPAPTVFPCAMCMGMGRKPPRSVQKKKTPWSTLLDRNLAVTANFELSVMVYSGVQCTVWERREYCLHMLPMLVHCLHSAMPHVHDVSCIRFWVKIIQKLLK
jgi:hypothetical protein